MFRQSTALLSKLRHLSILRRPKSISAPERALQYAVGQKIHGFTVREVTPVPDLFLTAVKLDHDVTGAQYLHAARDDSNNLFSVQFRTTPMDSTGVPHILEHTVLCGSQRFPCRDPFFKMLNRSLSTFMNAFTASDYTMYPFSTQNAKDFQNLLSVYLDAVFFPCLRELDFWYEGWRLENENPTDPSSSLVFKGVVFNEMKGVFSDNERVYAQHLQNKLLPDHTYSVVSGGEPLAITDLTWEQLKHFHATHYHPSNARFFTYGDLPLEQHLKQIQEEALCKFQRTYPNTAVPAQIHWHKPLIHPVDKIKSETEALNLLLHSLQCCSSFSLVIFISDYRTLKNRVAFLMNCLYLYHRPPPPLFPAGGVPVQYCEQPTNGMVYFRAMCNLNTLPEDLKIYVPLFCSVITKLGCGEMDYRQQAQQMELKTGGMSVTPQILSDTAELDLYEQGILLNSSCLERNLPDMFNLWSDLFNSPHFDDEERLRVLVMMAAQELSNGISYSGHLYAMTRAARTLTPSADLQETFSGMDQVIKYSFFLINLISKMYHFRCAVNATPQKIADAAVEVERFMGNIASHRKERKPVRPNIVKRPLDLHAPSGSAASRKLISVCEVNFKPCQMKTYFELPYPVNFVSECVRTVPFTHEDYASLCVLGRLMSAKFLHGEIREKGGAYGGGARMGGGGLFSFYSYRCVGVGDTCYYCFCLLRSPRLSHAAGLGLFLNGVSDEIKQAHRERLFAVTHKNLIDVAGRYLGIGQRTRGVAVLGPKNENIKKDPSWVVK
uniref:Pitrilysin metalloproteinase 1 n=1 Tax=Astyanax mexicanus TaxID=7994 RepID=A0A8B9J988_ASTMX